MDDHPGPDFSTYRIPQFPTSRDSISVLSGGYSAEDERSLSSAHAERQGHNGTRSGRDSRDPHDPIASIRPRQPPPTLHHPVLPNQCPSSIDPSPGHHPFLAHPPSATSLVRFYRSLVQAKARTQGDPTVPEVGPTATFTSSLPSPLPLNHRRPSFAPTLGGNTTGTAYDGLRRWRLELRTCLLILALVWLGSNHVVYILSLPRAASVAKLSSLAGATELTTPALPPRPRGTCKIVRDDLAHYNGLAWSTVLYLLGWITSLPWYTLLDGTPRFGRYVLTFGAFTLYLLGSTIEASVGGQGVARLVGDRVLPRDAPRFIARWLEGCGGAGIAVVTFAAIQDRWVLRRSQKGSRSKSATDGGSRHGHGQGPVRPTSFYRVDTALDGVPPRRTTEFYDRHSDPLAPVRPVRKPRTIEWGFYRAGWAQSIAWAGFVMALTVGPLLGEIITYRLGVIWVPLFNIIIVGGVLFIPLVLLTGLAPEPTERCEARTGWHTGHHTTRPYRLPAAQDSSTGVPKFDRQGWLPAVTGALLLTVGMTGSLLALVFGSIADEESPANQPGPIFNRFTYIMGAVVSGGLALVAFITLAIFEIWHCRRAPQPPIYPPGFGPHSTAAASTNSRPPRLQGPTATGTSDWEVDADRPACAILPRGLVTTRNGSMASVSLFLSGLVVYATVAHIHRFLKFSHPSSWVATVVQLIPMLIAAVWGALASGFCVTRKRASALPLLFGSACTILGLGLLTLLERAYDPWLLTGFAVLVGLGIGMTVPVLFTVLQYAVSNTGFVTRPAVASKVLPFALMLLSAGGLVGLIVQTWLTNMIWRREMAVKEAAESVPDKETMADLAAKGSRQAHILDGPLTDDADLSSERQVAIYHLSTP
ncbi:hypothetical protein IWQ60_001908, partial [Tieghemiomyces parasiticus]